MNKKTLMIVSGFCLLFVCTLTSLSFARTSLQPSVLLKALNNVDHSGGGENWDGTLVFYSGGSIRLSLEISEPGYYRLLMRGYGDKAGDVWPLVRAINPNDPFNNIYEMHVSSPRNPGAVMIGPAINFNQGSHPLDLNYWNDANVSGEDRNLYVDWFYLVKVDSPEQSIENIFVDGSPLTSYGSLIYVMSGMRNLLYNPEFEFVGSGWGSHKHSGNGDYTINLYAPEAAKFGSYGALVSSSDPSLVLRLHGQYVTLPAQNRNELIFSGWIKGIGHKGKAQLEFVGNNGSWKSIDIDIREGWQYFKVIINPATDFKNDTAVEPCIRIKDGVGTVYIDGLALYPVEFETPSEKFSLSAQLQGDKITLVWEEQPYNLFYEIHRDSDESFPHDDTLVDIVTGTSWTDPDTDLKNLTYYKVRSINDLFAPRESIAIINDIVPPNDLSENPTVSNELGGVLIVSWKPPAVAIDGERAAKYLIYKAQRPEDVETATPIVILEDPSLDSFSWYDRDVVPGEEYYYAIQCEDRVGLRNNLSEIIGPVIPNPDVEPPREPENVKTNNAIKGAVTISWSKPLPADLDGDLPFEYYILRSSNSYPDLEAAIRDNPNLLEELKVKVVDADTFEYIDTNVVAGQEYYYYVLSVDKAGNWNASPELAVTVLIPPAPTELVPQSPEVVANQPVKFSWQAPVVDYDDQVVSYSLEYAYSNDFSDAEMISGLFQTEYTLPAERQLTAGTVYWRVRAHFASGVVGVFSETATFEVIDVHNASFPVPYFNILPRVVRGNENIQYTYVLDRDGWITVKIFDTKGKLVQLLVPRQWQAAKDGNDYVIFHGEWNGSGLVDGLYIGQLILEQPDQRPIVIYRRFQVYRTK